jgi:AraC family transcriptional regulator
MMNIEFADRGITRIMGYSYKTTAANGQNLKDIPLFWKNYMQSGQMEKLHKESGVKSHDEYGLCIPKNPEADEMEYIIGVETNNDHIPAGYAHFEIPASKYAVFSTEPSNENNFTKNIQELWGYIFGTWLRETQQTMDEAGIGYELYDETCMTNENKVCKVYIPIKQD